MPVYLQTLIPGRIGLIGQYAGLDDALNDHDNLLLIGLYHFKMS